MPAQKPKCVLHCGLDAHDFRCEWKLSPADTRYGITIAIHNENQPIFSGL